MTITKNDKRGIGTIATLVALMLSSAAMATDTTGMKVVKDQATGQLRAPTADETKSMQLAEEKQLKAVGKTKSLGLLTGSDAPLAQIRADGSVMMELTEESMVYSVIKRNPDGSFNMQCLTGADAANKFINSSATTKQVQEHKHEK